MTYAKSLLAIPVFLIAACATYRAGVDGQVFEVVNSGAPGGKLTRISSADAYVIVHWTGSFPAPHPSSVCLHAAIGKSDERGRFDVPGRFAAPKAVVFQDDPAVMVYKPGFDQLPLSGPSRPIVRTLARSTLPVEMRIDLLVEYARAGCRDDATFKVTPLEDRQGVAARFYRALYDEAQALGPLPYALNHHLAILREKAGVPQPPEPPWLVEPIRPRPQLAVPQPVPPGDSR